MSWNSEAIVGLSHEETRGVRGCDAFVSFFRFCWPPSCWYRAFPMRRSSVSAIMFLRRNCRFMRSLRFPNLDTSGSRDIGQVGQAAIFGFPARGHCRLALDYFGRRGIGAGATASTFGPRDIGDRMSGSTAESITALDIPVLGTKAGDGKMGNFSTIAPSIILAGLRSVIFTKRLWSSMCTPRG
jgi:hypothetical protein